MNRHTDDIIWLTIWHYSVLTLFVPMNNSSTDHIKQKSAHICSNEYKYSSDIVQNEQDTQIHMLCQ